jgi:hypothetical protein
MLFDVVLPMWNFILIVVIAFIAGIAVCFVIVPWLADRIEEREKIEKWNSERNSE